MSMTKRGPQNSLTRRLFLDRASGNLEPTRFWVLVGIALILLGAFLFHRTGQVLFIRSTPFLAIGISSMPFACRLGLRIMESWRLPLIHALDGESTEFEKWWESRLSRVYSTTPFLLAGLLGVPVALAAFRLGAYFDGLHGSELSIYCCFVSGAAFCAGVGMYSIIFVAHTVYLLGDFHYRVTGHSYGLSRVGSGLAHCYLLAAGLWTVIAASGSAYRPGTYAPLAFIGPPSLILIIASFLLCQLPLHARMVDFKRSQLFENDRRVAEERSRWLASAPGSDCGSLESAQEQLEVTNSLPEWPFHWQALLGVSAAALGPFAGGAAKMAIGALSSFGK